VPAGQGQRALTDDGQRPIPAGAADRRTGRPEAGGAHPRAVRARTGAGGLAAAWVLRPGLPHWRRSRNMPCNMPFMPHVLQLEGDPATRERRAAPPGALQVTLAGEADTVDDEAMRGSQPCRVSRPGHPP
jgi:hypothetical protein